MDQPISRRTTMLGAAALLGALPSAARADTESLRAIETVRSGRLGVHALDLGSGRSLTYRADERFLMCSTFKTLLVAAVLSRVEAGRETLDRAIPYSAKDLLEYAPVTRAHLAEGKLSVEALCAAAVEVSDNTAANLLLDTVEGPAGLTRFVRGLGDPVTRLDRREPELNAPNGILDTTSPRAMSGSIGRVLFGSALGDASRDRLEAWMVSASTGSARLRAGLPAGWRAGDKSGTGRTQTNDVAVVRPPGRAPVIICAYFDAPDIDAAARDAALSEVAGAVARWVRSN